MEFSGEADDGSRALVKIKESKPDVAVVDISMPKMTGLQVAREIREAGFPVEFVVLTMFREEEYFNEARKLGRNYSSVTGPFKTTVITFATNLN